MTYHCSACDWKRTVLFGEPMLRLAWERNHPLCPRCGGPLQRRRATAMEQFGQRLVDRITRRLAG